MASPLELINNSLDKVTGTLADLGVEVSALQTQLFMLVLTAVVLFALRRKLLNPSKLDAPGAVALAIPLLLALAILVSWADQRLNPPEQTVVAGVIQGADNGVTLDLLSPEGRPMQSGQPVIEPGSGEFFARYEYGLTRYPRQIRINHPECDPLLEEVSLAQLRAGHQFQINYRCEHD